MSVQNPRLSQNSLLRLGAQLTGTPASQKASSSAKFRDFSLNEAKSVYHTPRNINSEPDGTFIPNKDDFFLESKSDNHDSTRVSMAVLSDSDEDIVIARRSIRSSTPHFPVNMNPGMSFHSLSSSKDRPDQMGFQASPTSLSIDASRPVPLQSSNNAVIEPLRPSNSIVMSQNRNNGASVRNGRRSFHSTPTSCLDWGGAEDDSLFPLSHPEATLLEQKALPQQCSGAAAFTKLSQLQSDPSSGMLPLSTHFESDGPTSPASTVSDRPSQCIESHESNVSTSPTAAHTGGTDSPLRGPSDDLDVLSNNASATLSPPRKKPIFFRLVQSQSAATYSRPLFASQLSNHSATVFSHSAYGNLPISQPLPPTKDVFAFTPSKDSRETSALSSEQGPTLPLAAAESHDKYDSDSQSETIASLLAQKQGDTQGMKAQSGEITNSPSKKHPSNTPERRDSSGPASQKGENNSKNVPSPALSLSLREQRRLYEQSITRIADSEVAPKEAVYTYPVTSDTVASAHKKMSQSSVSCAELSKPQNETIGPERYISPLPLGTTDDVELVFDQEGPSTLPVTSVHNSVNSSVSSRKSQRHYLLNDVEHHPVHQLIQSTLRGVKRLDEGGTHGYSSLDGFVVASAESESEGEEIPYDIDSGAESETESDVESESATEGLLVNDMVPDTGQSVGGGCNGEENEITHDPVRGEERAFLGDDDRNVIAMGRSSVQGMGSSSSKRVRATPSPVRQLSMVASVPRSIGRMSELPNSAAIEDHFPDQTNRESAPQTDQVDVPISIEIGSSTQQFPQVLSNDGGMVTDSTKRIALLGSELGDKSSARGGWLSDMATTSSKRSQRGVVYSSSDEDARDAREEESFVEIDEDAPNNMEPQQEFPEGEDVDQGALPKIARTARSNDKQITPSDRLVALTHKVHVVPLRHSNAHQEQNPQTSDADHDNHLLADFPHDIGADYCVVEDTTEAHESVKALFYSSSSSTSTRTPSPTSTPSSINFSAPASQGQSEAALAAMAEAVRKSFTPMHSAATSNLPYLLPRGVQSDSSAPTLPIPESILRNQSNVRTATPPASHQRSMTELATGSSYGKRYRLFRRTVESDEGETENVHMEFNEERSSPISVPKKDPLHLFTTPSKQIIRTGSVTDSGLSRSATGSNTSAPKILGSGLGGMGSTSRNLASDFSDAKSRSAERSSGRSVSSGKSSRGRSKKNTEKRTLGCTLQEILARIPSPVPLPPFYESPSSPTSPIPSSQPPASPTPSQAAAAAEISASQSQSASSSVVSRALISVSSSTPPSPCIVISPSPPPPVHMRDAPCSWSPPPHPVVFLTSNVDADGVTILLSPPSPPRLSSHLPPSPSIECLLEKKKSPTAAKLTSKLLSTTPQQGRTIPTPSTLLLPSRQVLRTPNASSDTSSSIAARVSGSGGNTVAANRAHMTSTTTPNVPSRSRSGSLRRDKSVARKLDFTNITGPTLLPVPAQHAPPPGISESLRRKIPSKATDPSHQRKDENVERLQAIERNLPPVPPLLLKPLDPFGHSPSATARFSRRPSPKKPSALLALARTVRHADSNLAAPAPLLPSHSSPLSNQPITSPGIAESDQRYSLVPPVHAVSGVWGVANTPGKNRQTGNAAGQKRHAVRASALSASGEYRWDGDVLQRPSNATSSRSQSQIVLKMRKVAGRSEDRRSQASISNPAYPPR